MPDSNTQSAFRTATGAGRVVVSGVGCVSSYAASAADLVNNIEAGAVVEYRPAIRDERILGATGLSFNPLHAGLPDAVVAEAGASVVRRTGSARKFRDPRTALLADISLATIEDAGLSREDMRREDFGVFWGSPGNQPNIEDYLAYAHANDGLDLWFSPSIRSLHCGSFRQDVLTAEYADFFELAAPICTLFSACSSSLSALLLATRKISQAKLKRALVLCFQEVTLFDILFLAGLNILSRNVGLPFCKSTDGISLGYGVGGILIEREDACADRSRDPYFAVRHITGGRGFSGSVNSPGMSVPFRSISQSIEAVLGESGLVASDIDCIFPHGNGIRANDQAEEMAMEKLFAADEREAGGGQGCPPIANYTYQTGYLLSASGVFDLIMAADVYRRDRILPFVSAEPIEAGEGLRFLQRPPAAGEARDATPGADAKPLATEVRHLLKTCIGIDGSIVNCVLERA
ncbi:MAG: hypothetical protein NXI24_17485 [bacterium]|nr:hypothetical protein [bacterium]